MTFVSVRITDFDVHLVIFVLSRILFMLFDGPSSFKSVCCVNCLKKE